MNKEERNFRTSFIRTFHHNLNNHEYTGRAFGISEEKSRELLDKLSRGVAPGAAERFELMTNRSKAESLYFGNKDASINYEKEGEKYLIIDYKIEPGTQIPADRQEKSNGYQVIIIGHDKRGQRKATTMIYGDLQSAASGAAGLMSEYSDFDAEEMYIRTFSDLEDFEY
jgi:hypothetical protein